MRRIILLFALMSASSPAHAEMLLPGEFFTPGDVVVSIAGPVFGNRTNTFCWRCGDASSSNDLRLVLQGRSELGVPGYPELFGADILGSLSVSGPAERFDGLDVSFTFYVTTTVTNQIHVEDHNRPEELPRPSVANGVLRGNLLASGGRQLIVTYGGRVDGVTFVESSDPFTVRFTVPPGGGSWPFTSEIFVDRQIEYTPSAEVVPEPTSLLLLGSGLAAAAIRVKRAARNRS